MKFQDMPYRRVTVEEVKASVEKCLTALADAKCASCAEKALRTYFEENKITETNISICQVRNSIDTTDTFYEAETAYYDEAGPLMEEQTQRLNDALLSSPYRTELEGIFGKLYFAKLENAKKQFSPAIIPELQEENRLCTAYEKLLGTAQLQYDGKTLNLSQMMPYRTGSDRAVRKEANTVYFGWFEANHDELDRLYAELVAVRTRMAKKLGYDNYIPLAYIRMERMDYNADMVKVYRDEVRKHIVPLVAEIDRGQAARLGYDKLYYYDVDYLFADGNPKPIGTPEELVEKARTMYEALSPETAEFFSHMVENELMDLVAKPGKTTGGYCTFFSAYKSPFIFSNFNGTKDDVDVLTHEAGHALQMYWSMRELDNPALVFPTLESCEIHSMSMELITSTYMEPFFGADTDKFRYLQLVDILRFVPYGCLVDDFQHHIYANPDMTPDERRACWRELERAYMPGLDFDGMDFLERGGRWHRQSHIYVNPFYYIDYTLAQICAVQFYLRFQRGDERAWEDYLTLCKVGGSRTFLELVKLGGLKSPFEEGVLPQAMEELRVKIESLKV